MKRVLVIDDDSAVRDILQDFLTLEGYMVNLASDGAMGIDALNSDNYDVILLDLVMPNMGGIDVLKGIKETRNADTPCVILTAHGTVQIGRAHV